MRILHVVLVGVMILLTGCSDVMDPTGAMLEPVDAALAVVPDGLILPAGQTMKLERSMIDPSGFLTFATKWSWSSSNPDVATVSSSGEVKAIKEGKTTIYLVSNGQWVTKPLQVTKSVKPVEPKTPIEEKPVDQAKPDEPTPEEPAEPSAALIASDGFESGKSYRGPTGFQWLGGPSAYTGHARSGNRSLRFTFQGYAGRSIWRWQEQRFEIGGSHKELWFEYWIYFPSGTRAEGLGSAPFEHLNGPSSDNNKFLHVWGDLGKDDTKYHVKTLLELERSSRFPGFSRLSAKYGTDRSRGGKVLSVYEFKGLTFDFPTLAHLGRWNQVRVYLRVGDPGRSNGVATLWIDGVRKLHATNLNNDPADGNASRGYTHGYLMGWPNSGYTRIKPTHIFIDDFKIFGQNPGW